MLGKTVAIVSGGSSGLGAATVRYLLKAGGRVVVADLEHQQDTFLKMAESASLDMERVYFAATDVTNEDQVVNALDMVESKFHEPVNAAISCAGIGTAKKTLSKKRGSDNDDDDKRPLAHDLESFVRTLQVNSVGTFNMARLSAQRMATRDVDGEHSNQRGCIINTASIAAYDGQIGQVAYASSKGAVVGMTLPMARDLAAFQIRVMTIAPGLFLTPLLENLPKKVQDELGASVPCPSRLGDPDEFASLVGHILTNPMLNGEVIRLDGALRMPP